MGADKTFIKGPKLASGNSVFRSFSHLETQEGLEWRPIGIPLFKSRTLKSEMTLGNQRKIKYRQCTIPFEGCYVFLLQLTP